MELSMGERRAVTRKLALSYVQAAKKEKSRILDELVGLTDWNRDYARTAIKAAGQLRSVKARKKRAPRYSPKLIADLATCWRVARYPTGKRLKAMLPALVAGLCRDGELVMSQDEVTVLCQMSPATIDRRLSQERRAAMPHGRSHTKPGTLLKSQIPIKTWSEWNDAEAGFVEIDLVGHEGGNPFGEFCFTLTMTDVATGFTVNRSVPNKAAIWVTEAIDFAADQFPFPILGIDSDNGSEFINVNLFSYCTERHITFTRSRPGNKNDGAHVEQKNWTHVRELVGYLRFDSKEELEVLNAIWSMDGRFTNHLLSQQKLISRHREGSKVIKRYDKAMTPVERTIASGVLGPSKVASLRRITKAIRPGELSRSISALCRELEETALTKRPSGQIRRVNEAFTHRDHPEVLGESTIRRSRRS
jgi:hypothetical protein